MCLVGCSAWSCLVACCWPLARPNLASVRVLARLRKNRFAFRFSGAWAWPSRVPVPITPRLPCGVRRRSSSLARRRSWPRSSPPAPRPPPLLPSTGGGPAPHAPAVEPQSAAGGLLCCVPASLACPGGRPCRSGERPLRLRGCAVPAGRPSTKQGRPQARASCATDQAPKSKGPPS